MTEPTYEDLELLVRYTTRQRDEQTARAVLAEQDRDKARDELYTARAINEGRLR